MKVFAENRKARNSYEFMEFFEAGIVLTGAETKSIRNGALSIIDAFATVENEEAILREMNIEPYKYAELIDYGPHLHFEVRLKNPSSVSCSLPYLDPTSRGRMNPYCFLDR